MVINNILVDIPKLLEPACFRVKEKSQSKAQGAVNDSSFISIETQRWFFSLAPFGRV